MENKLNEILNIIEKNHINFYFNHSKDELEEFKSDALSKFKLEDDYDLNYVVNYLIKKMVNENDSHTSVSFKNQYNDTIGLKFRFIDSKLYIYKTIGGYEKYLYSEVLKINDIDIKTIVKELEDITCAQTKEGQEFQIENALFLSCVLKSLPSIDNDTDEFKLTVNNNGVVEEFIAPKGMCMKQNYRYNIYNDVMQIIYSQCAQKYDNQMNDFVNDISKIENINTYIVDLRGNTGGNSQIIKPLIEFLKDKNVIVLIDKYVFSAGRFACNDLKNIGATFIGTDIGTPMNCFGNCPGQNYENFNVNASQKYFPFNDEIKFGIDNKEKLDYIKKESKYFSPRYFHPDIYVNESIDALKEDRDVYLEKAFEYIDSINKTRYDVI